jgi:hypothetical protein
MNGHESKGTWGHREAYGIRARKMHRMASAARVPPMRDPGCAQRSTTCQESDVGPIGIGRLASLDNFLPLTQYLVPAVLRTIAKLQHRVGQIPTTVRVV